MEGSGQTHPVAIAVDRTCPRHRLMIERIKELFDPSVDLQVVERPTL